MPEKTPAAGEASPDAAPADSTYTQWYEVKKGDTLWKIAKEKYGDGSIWDARDNARAAAHMFLVQAEKFKQALGHYPDYAERYIVHQQGIQGAIEHYTQLSVIKVFETASSAN